MTYKIHYAKLDLQGDIPCLEFPSIEEVRSFIDGNLNSAYPFYEGEDIFIQEYPSYEEAYKVALDMKEVSPLCYSSQPCR